MKFLSVRFFLVIIFLFLFTISGNAQCAPFIQGYTSLGQLNGHNYYLSHSNSKPTDAQFAAEALGGYLAVINDTDENEFIQQNISEMTYIGLNDVQTEGNLNWVNGDALSYNKIDPCNFCNENSNDLDYVIMAPWDGKWSFSSQWNQRKYIVEIPCNNISTSSITLNCPNDITITTDMNTGMATLDFTDATGTTDCPNGGLTISNTGNLTSGTSVGVGVYTIPFDATDTCGNTVECTLNITVVDGNTGSGCPNDISGFTLLGEFGDSKYFISNEKSQPADAQTIAEANGGYLVVINDQAENDFIQQHISEFAYIGLNDVQSEGNLIWVNGDALSFNNIDPCAFCNENTPDLDYAMMQHWDGAWSFSSQWNQRKYIVEVPCNGSTSPTSFPSIDCVAFQNGFGSLGQYICGEVNTDGKFVIITNQSTNSDVFDYHEHTISFDGDIVSVSIDAPHLFFIENNHIVEKDGAGNVLLNIDLPNQIVNQFDTNNADYIGVAQTSSGEFWLQGYVRTITSMSSTNEQGNDIVYTYKLDANGNILLSNTGATIPFDFNPNYLASDHNQYFGLIAKPDGGIESFTSPADLFANSSSQRELIRYIYDANGDFVSSEVMATSNYINLAPKLSFFPSPCSSDTYFFTIKIACSQFPLTVSCRITEVEEITYSNNGSTINKSKRTRSNLSSSGVDVDSRLEIRTSDGGRFVAHVDYFQYLSGPAPPVISTSSISRYDANNNIVFSENLDITSTPVDFFELGPDKYSIFYPNGTFIHSECPDVSSSGCPNDIAGFISLGEFNGSKYFISNEIAQPSDAQLVAEQNGGNLAIINSAAENDFLQQNISEMVYIGANDSQTEGTLQWVDGTAVGYTNFDICSFCNENSSDYDYIVMHEWNGGWSWSSVWNQRKYVVEVPCTVPLTNPNIGNTLVALPSQGNVNVLLGKVFPNPANDLINISIQSQIDQVVQIQMMDARGVLVKSEKVDVHNGSNTIELNISELPSGFYMIHVPDAKSNNRTKRFMKLNN